MKFPINALNMCNRRTMNKHSPIFVLLLALLMQVRVAYACENGAPWFSADCESHALVLDAHAGEPSDRGDRCDAGIDLALRNSRAVDSLGDLLSEPRTSGGGDQPLLLPVALTLAGLTSPGSAGGMAEAQAPVSASGTRLWLETARLRL